ncbi:rhodanese-like domain-containing protein [Actinomyces marmotae]|uniref:Rhodanese-like domain-containing protein n=1 Tax=Actinomyces marmotae TaxID=2737173 RepID=A0A6M8B946_9ACTO|nr:rhodanese-like domain-containing protein [Actinomyces marmotae]QKD79753.1 rhodanese-like domain-containing protein [Actinomyces marmotae]
MALPTLRPRPAGAPAAASSGADAHPGRRRVLRLVPAAAMAGLLAGCSLEASPSRASATTPSQPAPLQPSAGLAPGGTVSASLPPGGTVSASLPPGGTVIDVRSSEEYAQGHLEGAINIDADSADFDAAIDRLDRGAAYAVYCRSGDRSARAARAMRDKGFTSVLDLGGYQQASLALGVPVVTG